MRRGAASPRSRRRVDNLYLQEETSLGTDDLQRRESDRKQPSSIGPVRVKLESKAKAVAGRSRRRRRVFTIK